MKNVLTEEQWNEFVNNHCTDNEMKNISYQELMSNTNDGQLDFKKLTLPPTLEDSATLQSYQCILAVGYVVVDVVCLVLGAVSIRSTINASTVVRVTDIIAPRIPQIVEYAAIIAREGATTFERAKACWGILRVALQSPFKILSAIFSSLPWYKRALVIAQGCLTITAALVTDGAAIIAEIALELASFGFLVSDSVDAVSACSVSEV